MNKGHQKKENVNLGTKIGGLKKGLSESVRMKTHFSMTQVRELNEKLERDCGRTSQCETWFAHIERRSLLGHINSGSEAAAQTRALHLLGSQELVYLQITQTVK